MPPHPNPTTNGKPISAIMKRLFLVTIIIVFWVAGCGFGVSNYDNAVLDGVSDLNRNKPEKALKKFNLAVSIDPAQANAYVGRANTLNTLGRYEEAIADYNQALEINPNLANAFVNRGVAHSHLGQYDKAITDYEKALELDPKIDDPPSFVSRLFSNDPNTDKGIRKHLEYLKRQVHHTDPKS